MRWRGWLAGLVAGLGAGAAGGAWAGPAAIRLGLPVAVVGLCLSLLAFRRPPPPLPGDADVPFGQPVAAEPARASGSRRTVAPLGHRVEELLRLAESQAAEITAAARRDADEIRARARAEAGRPPQDSGSSTPASPTDRPLS